MAGAISVDLNPAAPPPLTGARLYLAAFGISLGFFLVMLDITIANVAVPHIAGNLGASPAQGTWIITGYAVAEAICLPLTGWLSKRFGGVRVYLAALGGFTIASALCGMASTMPMLVGFRVLQGLCGAPLLPLAQILMLGIFPKDKAAMAVALPAMTSVLAPISGPIIGGWITDNISWRWIFYINIPFVLLSLPVVWRLLAPYETRRVIERVDKVGLALLILWVGALQLMLDLGREHGWFESGLIVGLAIVAAIGFVAFIVWELTDDAPIVDLRIMRHRGLWTASISLAIGYSSLMAGSVLVPLWAQTTLGYTATHAGLVMAPLSIFSLIVLPLTSRLVTRMDPRILVCMGFFWVAFISLLRADTSPDLDIWQMALPQLLQGMSTSFYMLSLMIIGLGAVKPSETAAAAGLMAFLRIIGTAIGISWSTTIWEDHARAARAQMVGLLNGADSVIETMMTRGMSNLQARATIEAMIDAQSRTIAFDHIFTLVGALSAATALFIWLIPRPAKNG